MAKSQSASLERKKLLADPILVSTIVVLVVFLTVFILYPLAILLVDSFVSEEGFTFSIFHTNGIIWNNPSFYDEKGGLLFS